MAISSLISASSKTSALERIADRSRFKIRYAVLKQTQCVRPVSGDSVGINTHSGTWGTSGIREQASIVGYLFRLYRAPQSRTITFTQLVLPQVPVVPDVGVFIHFHHFDLAHEWWTINISTMEFLTTRRRKHHDKDTMLSAHPPP